MGAAFGDASGLQDHDLVGVADGGQAMGDGDGGAVGREGVDGVLDGGLRAGVEGAGRPRPG
ncbi:hypothetical protein LT493_01740 [Streptomyces tricolor]|nr:hypothetical protein [Streptomyces tricolor]